VNAGMQNLQAYPFEKLADLTRHSITPEIEAIPLTIGEPQHEPPQQVLTALTEALAGAGKYPTIAGTLSLRQSIASWLANRFRTRAIDPDREVLPVNGTREGLFAVAQALTASSDNPLIALPNPFYQIYEGAALLAGATPLFISASEESGYLANYQRMSNEDWQACKLLFLCTPGNPSGQVIPMTDLQALIEKALEHDVVLVSDECYSELYFDEQRPPTGLLEAAHAMGNTDFKQCLAFHSLSKRSNLPGLRSGFVAGDASLIETFRRYRTYHGCAMPLHHQTASTVAWSDETHVINNRELYRQKFAAVLPILSEDLDVAQPDAGFYLWPRINGDDQVFAKSLLEQQNVSVLPGSYLGREVDGVNPGSGHVRIALVSTLQQTLEAAERIALFLSGQAE